LISISPAWLEISYAIVFAVIFFYKIDWGGDEKI
jgi:hypothetical protein